MILVDTAQPSCEPSQALKTAAVAQFEPEELAWNEYDPSAGAVKVYHRSLLSLVPQVVMSVPVADCVFTVTVEPRLSGLA